MTAPMYTLLLLAVIFANLPFLTTRLFAVKPMARKHIGHHLIELAAGFALTAALEEKIGALSGERVKTAEFYDAPRTPRTVRIRSERGE